MKWNLNDEVLAIIAILAAKMKHSEQSIHNRSQLLLDDEAM